MADLTQAIREMLKKGMSEASVLDSLRELGVTNPEHVFKQATEAFKPMAAAAPPAAKAREEPKLEVVSLSAEETKAEVPGMQAMPQTTLSNIGSVGEKLDEAIALLKALQEINKKILETNRDILLRLK